MTKHTAKRLFASLSLSILTVSIGIAAEPTAPAAAPAVTSAATPTASSATKTSPVVKKSPIDFSVTSSLGYDSNVYLANNGVLGNRESTVSTLGAKVATKFASGVALSYSAVATRFWDETSQDNVRHVLGASWAKKVGGVSWNAATEFAQVDGSSTTANYNGGGKSALSTTAPRERNEQLQNKTDLMARYETSRGFVRGIGRLQYWDMQTKVLVGEKYVDRYDIQGGVDVGRAFTKGGPEYYLGYRNGYQYQDFDGQALTSVKSASNHYDRFLVGMDDKISPSLKIAAQTGWSIHEYGSKYTGDRGVEGIFSDITLTWAATPNDELQFKTSRALGLTSTGTNSTLNTTYQLVWKRTFTKAWSASLTGRFLESDYAPSSQDDIDYTAMASVTWAATKAISASLSFSQDWIRENHNTITSLTSKNRECDRSFVSASATWKM